MHDVVQMHRVESCMMDMCMMYYKCIVVYSLVSNASVECCMIGHVHDVVQMQV